LGNTDGMKRTNFFWRAFPVSKFISNFITDIPKITQEFYQQNISVREPIAKFITNGMRE